MPLGVETTAAVEREDGEKSQLDRLLLYAIDAYCSRNANGPTVPELAADLGITPDFGHNQLVAQLQRQLSLGRVSHYGRRFKLTRAGRRVLDSEIVTRSISAPAGLPVSG